MGKNDGFILSYENKGGTQGGKVELLAAEFPWGKQVNIDIIRERAEAVRRLLPVFNASMGGTYMALYELYLTDVEFLLKRIFEAESISQRRWEMLQEKCAENAEKNIS